MTGLAAGWASGWPVFEAANIPGGICSSYYIRPGESRRLSRPPEDKEAYRFEIGGGHWIFKADADTLHVIKKLIPVNQYIRRSAVYFQNKQLYVPYPLQNHLRFFSQDVAQQALAEMVNPPQKSFVTMQEWLEHSFGPTLCELFFYPFHELYTAGLYKTIAPQDAYKSPVDLSLAIQGASQEAPPVGYNATFAYPVTDLRDLAQRMADRCDIHYEKKAVKVDMSDKIVYFADGSEIPYRTLISTLPLNRMLEMTELKIEAELDPYTSVLVLNIGAIRGGRCPDNHWLYISDSQSGFHRVGFYSNVDPSFLPISSSQTEHNRVGIYIERAYPGGRKPSDQEIQIYADSVVKELQEWLFIKDVEVVDPTWIEVAYTWSYPKSYWRQQGLQKLEKHGIYQLGRYGRWKFQGIADSIKEGLTWGGNRPCANR